ncbi:MAG: CHASE domain-containing protein, partial [Aureispira sp.]
MASYITPRWFKIILVLLIGLPISLGTFNYINCAKIERNAERSKKANQEAKQKLKAEIKKISLAISSLYVLFEVADTIDRPTFNNFTIPFLRNLPGIKALEWTPRLKQAERAQHEQRIRAEGFKDYAIKTFAFKARAITVAPSKAYYYPVQYIIPEQWN